MSFFKSLLPVLGAAVGSVVPGVGTALGASLGGAAAGAIGGAQQQSKAGKLNDQVLKMALARDQELSPLRQRAIMLGQNLQPGRPDLSSAFASGNPFARQKPDVSMLSMPQPPAPSSAGAPPVGGGGGGGMMTRTGAAARGMMPGSMGGMDPQALQQALQRRGEMMR